MNTIKCPVCDNIINTNINNAIDEDGEVFICSKCKNKIRYVNRINYWTK